MKVQEIRRIINAYSRQTGGHPFEDYGNDVKITVNDDCIIQECSVRTQYEARGKEERRRPYKGWAVASRKYFDLSEVDPWSYRLNLPSDFLDDEKFYEVDGSAHVESCVTCNGQGRTTCYSCMGKGKEVCPRCGGDYQHLRCSSCGGDGNVSCQSCGGKGRTECKTCHGTGTVRVPQNEMVNEWDYNQQRMVPRYKNVWKDVSCSACSGRGYFQCKTCHGRGTKTCSRCDGRGYVTCPDCTQGMIICKTCGGGGYLVCTVCEGQGRNEFRYVVSRTLSQETLSRFLCDSRVREFAETHKLDFESVDFKVREDALGDELYPEDVRCSSALSKLVSKADTDDGKILFQEARVRHVGSTYVEYEYDGNSYKGIICNDTFFSEGASPIDIWASELVDKAEKKMKRGSAAATLKMLNQAEQAGGNKKIISDLMHKALLKLDRLYSAGVGTAFWLFFVFVTPALFNFYMKLNPVMSWAIVTNNPNWRMYNMLPLVQTLIFIGAMVIIRLLFGERARTVSGNSYSSVWIYYLQGLGEYSAACLVALAALLLVNYLGISVLTTFIIGWAITLVALVIAIAVLLIKWIVGWFV